MIDVKVQDSTGTVILNRPEKRNALSRKLIGELKQAFEDLHSEKRVRAVILTGAGSAFCAGMDLGEMLETSREEESVAQAQWRQDAVDYRDLLQQMLLFPKPIIAAVNGPVMAGGVGLMLASDIVVASGQAKLGLPEPLRGLVAGIVAPLLYFRVGASHAAYLLLTAQTVDAARAYEMGLFQELVDENQIWAKSKEIADHCAKSAPEAIQLSKRMLNEHIGEDLSTMFASGAAISATARTTESAAEGLAAFLEKREPNWP